MTFCLDSTIIRPEKNKDINNAIILLHGYGGVGKDICPIQSLYVQMAMKHAH